MRKIAIQNDKIVKYINECIEHLKQLGILNQSWGDDIDFIQNNSFHTFGSMRWPKSKNDNFVLCLSSYMFEEEEKSIKNTIYHELCHYIQMKQELEEDVLEWINGKLRRNPKYYMRSNYESAHGSRWKLIAAKVSRATGNKITVKGNYETHYNVGQELNKRINYIVKCKRCGVEFKYQKKTAFVQELLDHNGHSIRWWCNCGSHDFEIIKGE